LIEAVVKSGGLPIILPSVDPQLAVNYLPLFDGVIFAGGADVGCRQGAHGYLPGNAAD
jgi:putative glutamine amidotransferase